MKLSLADALNRAPNLSEFSARNSPAFTLPPLPGRKRLTRMPPGPELEVKFSWSTTRIRPERTVPSASLQSKVEGSTYKGGTQDS